MKWMPTNEELGERHDPWFVALAGAGALALLLLVVMPRVMKWAAGPMEDQAHEHLLLQSASHMKQVENRLVAFEHEFGRYPAGYRGIDMLIWDRERPNPPPWAATDRKILVDGWARPLIYSTPSADGAHPFELTCLGRDGRPGGIGPDRDISNWDWPSRLEAAWPDEAADGAAPPAGPASPPAPDPG